MPQASRLGNMPRCDCAGGTAVARRRLTVASRSRRARSRYTTEELAVEVAYALPEKQRIIALSVPLGCTAWEAASRSGISREFPEIDLETVKMGVFGKALPDPRSYQLRAGERVEIYRPLVIDPKEARRARARKPAAAGD